VSGDRERDVTTAFVSLSSSLANGYDIVDLLDELVGHCARLIDVDSAGLLLADGLGVLHVMAASSEVTRLLEVFQLQRAEGPCRDCFHTGRPVSVPDLEAAVQQWPEFVPAALEAGFASLHAVPMRLRDNTLGAMGLFGVVVGSLTEDDLSLAQALADVASVAIVQDKAASERAAVVEQLQAALNSRVVIEQAKGIVAHVGNLDMARAFVALRQYARNHNQRLTEVAHAVVGRLLPVRQLLDEVGVPVREL
jgi:GAF domain-containing protein